MTTHHEDDALRARLAGLDPMPLSVAVDPPTSPRAHELMERAMTATTEQHVPDGKRPGPTRRTSLLATAAAVVALAVGVTAVVTSGGSSPTPKKAKTTLALQGAGGGGTSLGSCLPFSVSILKDMPVAFAGTATAVSRDATTLTVTHWYKGGSADVVTVQTPLTSAGPGEFVLDKHYLVTATNGTVNGCGYTGEATADLQKYFDQAFTP